MIFKVQLFASLKETLGDTIELDVPEPATVSRLMDTFLDLAPQFAHARKNLNVAVDLEYSPEDKALHPGQEIAIFPPVSGGARP